MKEFIPGLYYVVISDKVLVRLSKTSMEDYSDMVNDFSVFKRLKIADSGNFIHLIKTDAGYLHFVTSGFNNNTVSLYDVLGTWKTDTNKEIKSENEKLKRENEKLKRENEILTDSGYNLKEDIKSIINYSYGVSVQCLTKKTIFSREKQDL